MISEEKIAEIKKEVKNGEPAGEIRGRMLRDGYSEEDIKKCFDGYKYDMGSWYLVFAIVFLLAGIWVYLRSRGLLMLIFSTIMFFLYYLEKKKPDDPR